jgi:NTP pyrophosphatase (non-canonical NTP hydrolase)
MIKLTKNDLLDTMYRTGNTLEELKELVDAMNSVTTMREKICTHDITLLSLYERTKMKDHDIMSSAIFDPMELPSYIKGNLTTKRSKVKKLSPELVDEWEQNRLAILYTNPDTYDEPEFFVTSGSFLQTSDRFGLTGHAISTPSICRDAYLAEIFARRNVPNTMVVREIEGVKKAFTLLSDKYCHIDQNVLFEIIEYLEKDASVGKVKCHHWEVDNFITKLYVEFPEKAEEFQKLYKLPVNLVPGLLITTSDTGNSSFKFAGTWRLGNSISIASEYKRKHIGDVRGEDIKDEVAKKVFPEYAAIPDALCNLMTIEIEPELELTTTEEKEQNKATVDELIDELFHDLGMVKLLGKKLEKALKEKFKREFIGDIHYTAYDIAIQFMSLPERAVVIQNSGEVKNLRDLTSLQQAVLKVPFVNFEKHLQKIKVVLTA